MASRVVIVALGRDGVAVAGFVVDLLRVAGELRTPTPVSMTPSSTRTSDVGV